MVFSATTRGFNVNDVEEGRKNDPDAMPHLLPLKGLLLLEVNGELDLAVLRDRLLRDVL